MREEIVVKKSRFGDEQIIGMGRMMSPRKERHGNQQAKNPRKAEATTDRTIYIEGGERAD
jgi:hypothetical protein